MELGPSADRLGSLGDEVLCGPRSSIADITAVSGDSTGASSTGVEEPFGHRRWGSLPPAVATEWSSAPTILRRHGWPCSGRHARRRCATSRSPSFHVHPSLEVAVSTLAWPAGRVPEEVSEIQENEARKG